MLARRRPQCILLFASSSSAFTVVFKMQRYKTLLCKAAKTTMEEYFQMTSLNGFRLLYYIRRRKFQRFVWFLFIILGCGFATYVVLITLFSFMENPTVTTLASQKDTIWDIPFPGIAVCSTNRMSRQRVVEYAQEMSKRSDRPTEYWIENLVLLAGYYDNGAIDFDDAIAFEIELKKILGKDYDIVKLLKRLSPPCEELLMECHFGGKLRNCSSLFEMIATVSGYCCMFNYQLGVNERSSRHLFYPNGTGVETGLVLLLNASTSDYYYKSRFINGFHLQISDVQNFPDTSTGSAREVMVAPGDDLSIELSIMSQTADEEARRFSANRRRCYFENEHTSYADAAYSQAECYSRCRTRDILFMCVCVPYYTPADYLTKLGDLRYCSTLDAECLNYFAVTWRTFQSDWLIKLNLQQGVLVCEGCYQLCSFNNYYYRRQRSKLSQTRFLRSNRKFFTNLKNVTSNVSLVKFYFPKRFGTQYNKNAIFNWYQILSNIGGVIGISIGCSIISGFEILYFLTYRLSKNFIKQYKTANAK